MENKGTPLHRRPPAGHAGDLGDGQLAAVERWVPGLFSQLELDQIFGPLKDHMLAEAMMSGCDFSEASRFTAALSMDPSDPGGRRARRVTHYSLDARYWMDSWNEKGLCGPCRR